MNDEEKDFFHQYLYRIQMVLEDILYEVRK